MIKKIPWKLNIFILHKRLKINRNIFHNFYGCPLIPGLWLPRIKVAQVWRSLLAHILVQPAMKVVMVGNVRTQTRTLPPLRTSSEVNCKVKGKMMMTPWLRRRDWGEEWRGWEDQRRLWVRRRKNQDLLPVRLKIMEYHHSCSMTN